MSNLAKIKFGTDGWRAVIARDYTFQNLERVTQLMRTTCARMSKLISLWLVMTVVSRRNTSPNVPRKFWLAINSTFRFSTKPHPRH